MMWFSTFIILAILTQTGMAAPVLALFQQATTTKRQGSAVADPDQLPGNVGIPTPPSVDHEAEMMEQRRVQLEELYKERVKKDSSGQNGAPKVHTGAPATPAATPPAVNPAVVMVPKAPPPAPRPDAGKAKAARGSGVSLSFTEAPIDRVVNAIMTELGYSYIIDPQVSGSVNLFTVDEIPRDKLFGVMEQVLKMNGHAVVRQEGLYVVLPIPKSPKIPHRILVPPTQRSKKSREPAASQENKPAGKESQQEETQEVSPQQKTGQEAETSESSELGPQGAALKPVTTEPSLTPQNPQEETKQEPDSPGPTVLTVGQSEAAAQIEHEEGVFTYIIPLHYLPSSDVLTMVQPFITEGATVIDFVSANILIITDYRRNIQQVLNLVRVLDTDYFDLNTVELIQVENNSVSDVAEDLGKIFAPGDKAGGVRMVAIERLNSLLVVTHAPSVLDEVKEWLERLDAPSTNMNMKTYVYEVENNTAANIAEVLAQLYEGGEGLPTSATEGEGKEEATRRPTQQAGFVEERERRRGGMGRGGMGPSLEGRPMSTQSNIRAVDAGNVRIIVNEFNNSLIIQSTEADYRFLLQTIKQLDVLPRQVLIEARIYSVDLTDNLSFGVAAFLRARQSEGPATTGSISGAGDGGAGGTFNAVTRAFIGQARELEATINALRSQTNVELVEAPSLMAVDGMQASINVGAEVPVTTSSYGNPLGGLGGAQNFVSSIQFRPTGTTLLIMPRISAGGIVTMDLAVEVSSATGAALTPTINRSYVETSLIIRDGQTVAIAGVISESLNRSKSRVPLLGDIPIIGALFGNTTKDKRRAELVVFITPHVIRNLPTAVELTLDFQRSLKNAYGFIERKRIEEKQLKQWRREEELKREAEGR
jgi:general secretion pathway protein D